MHSHPSGAMLLLRFSWQVPHYLVDHRSDVMNQNLWPEHSRSGRERGPRSVNKPIMEHKAGWPTEKGAQSRPPSPLSLSESRLEQHEALRTMGSSSRNRGDCSWPSPLLFLKEPGVVTPCAVIKLVCNLISGSSLTFYRVIKFERAEQGVSGPQHPLRWVPIHALSPLTHVHRCRGRTVLSHSPGNTSWPCRVQPSGHPPVSWPLAEPTDTTATPPVRHKAQPPFHTALCKTVG